MFAPDGVHHPAISQRPAIGTYLQAVASALADPDATPEGVLRVAQARGVQPNGAARSFRTPDPRFRYASLTVVADSAGHQRPSSVLFVCDEAGGPLLLSDLEAAFGPWVAASGATLSDPNPVQFRHMYPTEFEAARPDGPLTHVRAALDGPVRVASARVRSVLLRRFGGP